ncbi:mucoidy inhibitor MuiA family protein [Actinokineospora globicatena]|uniref:mucoidy inhibitor MuiA family protein n=1 Tax=Actinokineospora globicatena TaxID=103729 RepID=UPI002552D45C|nr:mucoidy inhibitor MuiA family protein [Actinokineospora globicatena]
MTIRVDAGITAVTVYPGQARITRSGEVALSAGEHRVTIGGLPQYLHADSIRVAGSGPATVLGVDVLTEHHHRTQDAALGELEERRNSLHAALQELGDRGSVLDARAELITTLGRRAGSTFAQALAKDETDPARVAQVGDALAEQLAEVYARRRELIDSVRTTQAELDEVERRIAGRQSGHLPDTTAIEVELAVSADGDVELEVSYLVDSANWESRYDVRLVGTRLTLTWYGLVTQHTGEDWPECDLRLSTARPATSVDVPELAPWYLDVLRPVPQASRSRSEAQDMQRGYGMAGGAAMPAAAAPGGYSPPPPIAESYASVEHGEAATVYRPSRLVAVPSDSSAHRTTVATVDLAAELDHVTVPLVGTEAYLRATVTNTSEHTIRPGRASIFHDAEFVGVTNLAAWAPGEEVELTLGIDDRVRVERDLVKRSTSKAVLGGTRRQEATWRIKVGNFGPRPARITVVDQVPVSRSESVVVRDLVLKPQPAEQTDIGEVTWKLTVPPAETGEITISFRVDVAKDVTLTGWRD